MLTLCCLWGWRRVGAGLLLGFCGLLHPSEIFDARRRHLRLRLHQLLARREPLAAALEEDHLYRAAGSLESVAWR